MIYGWICSLQRLIFPLFMTTALSACGGGGGGSNNGGGFVPPPEPEGATISLSLTDLSGNTITEITPLTEGLVRVSVTSPRGVSLPQEVINAEVSLGRLIPESGTALTNSNGEALFVMQANGVDGAGTLTASMTYDNVSSSGSINFSVSTDLPFTLTPEILDINGSTVSSAATGDRLTLKVLLTDDRVGKPIQNQVITVDIGDLGILIPTSGNAVTNADGEATFIIAVGELSGAYPVTISAIVPGGGARNSVTLNVSQAVRKLGHIDRQGNFVEGAIKISPSGQLSPGGTASLSLAVVDAENKAVTTEEVLTVTSSCLFGGLAALNPASPITMGSNISVDYSAQGCSGEDLITATLTSSGAEASGVVDIAPATAKRIVFDNAEPEIIALRGTGSASDIAESSIITFSVSDGEGTPVSDVRVNFSLLQTVGGLALECSGSAYCDYATDDDQAKGRSNRYTTNTTPAGTAATRVLAGTVATPAQVLAYVDLNNNGEQDLNEPASASKTLVVSTGLPDQNSISLSASVLNVEGAYQVDGKTSKLTVRMADSFNNPVPDGTAAIFSTEIGSVIGSCNTTGGLCSVDWTSQSPRSSDTVEQFSAPITINENLDNSSPNRYSCPSHRENHGPCPDDIGNPAINPPGAPRGGRSTVLVTAFGEESFVDRNSNGLYDEGEYWTNLTEAFIDHNEDGVYTPSQRANCDDPAQADDVCIAGFEETFSDRNANGVFDLNNVPNAAVDTSLPDGVYNGVLCSMENASAGICSREILNVRDSLVLVNAFASAEHYDLMLISASSKTEPRALYENSFYNLFAADRYNNSPPPGSTITYDSSGDCEAATETTVIPDSNRAGAFSAVLVISTEDYAQSLEEADGSDPDLIKIKLTLPNGSFTTATYACAVSRCAEDPSSFPQFSPAPPQCSGT